MTEHPTVQLRNPEGLALLLGVEPSSIAGLSPSTGRGIAYRYSWEDAAPGAETALENALGELGERDAYWLERSPCYYAGSEVYGLALDAFEQSLGRVRTFMTNDRYDPMVYTDVLPALLESRGFEVTAPATSDRTGVVEVRGGTAGDGTQIRFPTYESGHEVTVGAPVEFGDDLADWLER